MLFSESELKKTEEEVIEEAQKDASAATEGSE
jgi:hypothetical protein